MGACGVIHHILLLGFAALLLPRVGSSRYIQSKQPIVRTYELSVSFFPDEHRIEGQAAISFEPAADSLLELVFYLHGELSVESVGVDSAAVPFVQDRVFYEYDYSLVATRVVVDLAGIDFGRQLHTRYSGYFNPSKARSPSDYMRIDHDGVYLRSYGYSLWFPVFLEAGDDDYRVSFTNVTLTTPKQYSAVFVGERLSDTVSDDRRVSEWRAIDVPIVAAQCTAHRFSVDRDGSYFVYAWPDEHSLAIVPQLHAFASRFTDLLRRHYRAKAETEQIHIVQMPRYGDISSGNVVGMASASWLDFGTDDYARQTLAHEFVHPFVAVPTGSKDPMRTLVLEGFPSYFHWPLLAALTGETHYDRHMDAVQQQYLEKKSTGRGRRGKALPPEKPLTRISEDEIGIYKDRFVLDDRVVLFFDYLRRRMGSDRFLLFAHQLLNRDALDREAFQELVLSYTPGAAEDLRLWLDTNEYPTRFHRQISGG